MVKEIKIFLSSTFLDMNAERDYIHHVLYPRLSDLCRNYGLNVYIDDLRWGASEDDLNSNNAIYYCLNEIDNCRPFFIGLVGNRYGWIPPVDEKLLSRYGWLDEHKNISVTEMEFWYALFYGSVKDVSGGFCLRKASQNDISECDNAQMLNSFKQRIRESDYPVLEDYCSPQEVGDFIYNLIESYLSKNFVIDEIESGRQTAYQNMLLGTASNLNVFDKLVDKTAGFTYQDNLINYDMTADSYEWFLHHIQTFINSGNQKLILSIPASGTRIACNQMLAKWSRGYLDYSGEKRNFIVVNTTCSQRMRGWVSVVEYVLNKIRDLYGISEDFSVFTAKNVLTRDKRQNVFDAFCAALSNGVEGVPLTIVIEDADLLSIFDCGNSLVWLPTLVGKNVFIVCTTGVKANAAALKRQGWVVRNFPTKWNAVADLHYFLSVLEKSGKVNGLNRQKLIAMRDVNAIENGEATLFLSDYFSRFVSFENANAAFEVFLKNPNKVVEALYNFRKSSCDDATARLADAIIRLLLELKIPVGSSKLVELCGEICASNGLLFAAATEVIAPFVSYEGGCIAVKNSYVASELKGAVTALTDSQALAITDRLIAQNEKAYDCEINCEVIRLLAKYGLLDRLEGYLSQPSEVITLITHAPEVFEGAIEYMYKHKRLDTNKMFERFMSEDSRAYPVLTFLFAINEKYEQGDELEAYFDVPFAYHSTTEPYLDRYKREYLECNYSSLSGALPLVRRAMQKYIEQNPQEDCSDIIEYLKITDYYNFD